MPRDYILVNDIHLSDRPPSSCTDTYQDDIFALLDQINALAAERHAHGIIWAGDVFHHKTPGRTSHGTVMRLIRVAEAAPCPVHVVLGNHDLSHDRPASIGETQPLGVAIVSGAVQHLAGWMSNQHNADQIYGVPWLGRFTDDTVHDALADYVEFHQSGRPALVVTHAPLYPPGQELKYEFFPADTWATAQRWGTVHYGHVHDPHGIYTVNGVTFSNPGALSRGSLHEHNLTRTPAVAIWDAVTGTITHHQLDAKPAAEVFRLAEVTATRTAQAEFDAFLDAIGQTRVELTSIESVMAAIRDRQLGPDLEHAILGLLEQACGG